MSREPHWWERCLGPLPTTESQSAWSRGDVSRRSLLEDLVADLRVDLECAREAADAGWEGFVEYAARLERELADAEARLREENAGG